MKRKDLREFHYITHIDNLTSIAQHGILSRKLASKIEHTSIAMPEIQDRRSKVTVDKEYSLHYYANLYFDARNPMLYKIRDQHRQLCILSIDTATLDLSGVIIADRNASSKNVQFAPAPKGLDLIDEELVFAPYWTRSSDPSGELYRKAVKCAEVLVPRLVPPEFIIGAYVSCGEACDRIQQELAKSGISCCLSVNPNLFFR